MQATTPSPEDLAQFRQITGQDAPAPASGGEGPAPSGGGPAPEDLAQFRQLTGQDFGTPAPVQRVAALPRQQPRQKTQYQRAAVTPTDSQKWENTPWSEVGKGFVKTAIPSVGGVIGDTAKMAYTAGRAVMPWNWDETGEALGKIKGSDVKDAGKAVLKQMNSVWGTEGLLGGKTAGLKKGLATDPASIAMDASTLLGGAGLVAKGAGLGKVASGLQKASGYVDPIQASLKAAKVVASPVVGAGRLASGAMSGVHPELQKVAAKAGASGSRTVRDEFLRHHRGVAPTDESIRAVDTAFGKLNDQTMAALRADKSLIYANNPGAVPFNKVDAAFNAAKANLNRMSRYVGVDDIRPQFAKVEDLINDYRANPNLRTMENMDKLRNEIGRLQHADKARFTEHLGPIYGAVRETMEDVSPKYTRTLEEISDARREFDDMRRTLGVGSTAMSHNIINRQLRAIASKRGRDVFQKVAKIDPSIERILAGIATHEPMAQGLRNVLTGIGGAGGVAALAMHPEALVPVVGGALAGAAAASPKITGKLNYGYGALDRYARHPAVKGAYYAGRTDDEMPPEGGVSPEVAGGAPDRFDRMLKAESAYGQFSPEGVVVRSPKGAIGAAQIMPGTAREAAEAAGEAYDEDRLHNDEQYNIKLGRAYFNKLLDRFKDEDLAAAAYNAGPARLQSALSRARKMGGYWLDLMPAETQAYVKKTAAEGRAERASGGRAGINHSSEAQALIRKAEAAKKSLGETTKPLLNASDDHIAKALAVANESV